MTEQNRQFEGPRWGQGEEGRGGARALRGERQWGSSIKVSSSSSQQASSPMDRAAAMAWVKAARAGLR